MIKKNSDLDFERLKNLENPGNIIIPWSKDYRRPFQLVKYDEVVFLLEKFVQENNFDKKNFTLSFLNSNDRLYKNLIAWGYALDGSISPRAFLKKLGYEFVMPKKMNLQEYIEGVQEMFSKEFILQAFKNGLTKEEVVAHTKTNPRFATVFAARSRRTRENPENSVGNIVDRSYLKIFKDTGFLPSEILWFQNISDERISKHMKKLYFAGEDISAKALESNPETKRLVYHIKHPYARPDVPIGQKKYMKVNYSSELPRYLGIEKIKLDLNQPGAIGELGAITEFEFAFFLEVLKNHDPYLKNFPELKSIITPPLEHVVDSSIHELRKLKHQNDRFSDGRFVAGGEQWAVELKTGFYDNKKTFYSSLNNYSSGLWDDNSRFKKLLVITNTSNGDLEKIPKGWSVLTGPVFSKMYVQALELLFEHNQHFETNSPMANYEDMMAIHSLIHDDSYLLRRNGHKFFRTVLKDFYKSMFKCVESPSLYNDELNSSSLQEHYSISMKSLGIFSMDFLEFISEGDLFYDSESTGFRNTGSFIPMFSFGQKKADDFIVDVYFANSPLKEKKNLEVAKRRIETSERLIGFNNRNFDDFLLEERMFFNCIDYKINVPSVDLYLEHLKKHAGVHKYTKATLKKFETINLGLDRRGDVPGREIPEKIRQYIISNDSFDVKRSIMHVSIDTISLPYLLLHKQGIPFKRVDREITFDIFRNYLH